ncbi:MAG: hypothetical protein IM473_05870 [Microcystis sp. M015S2]|uniref:hypothetical protein n=1 Tax=unclassified Microcystis TaxID=2643300 RepID=UPI00258EBC1C|nr:MULTISPECIES: hypothetical protein [unclassified Microcystis]MCA2707856.1 hypothetical protein [Microcystis sp. M025S2]MCA2741948.1 hypothetical protein [Microcystis sp. M015S2]MCA2757367.1 hypothetical protein [Microcystis sp. M145S2]
MAIGTFITDFVWRSPEGMFLPLLLLLDKGSFVDAKHLVRFCRAKLSTLFR